MKKFLIFDMDGTLVDLYGVKNWLALLTNEDVTPYRIAHPIYDMDTLVFILEILKDMGYEIVVTTWLAKNSSEFYKKKVAAEKEKWLKRYGFPYDHLYCVPYGTPKHKVTKFLGGVQILFDDDEAVRKEWNLGYAIEAETTNILKILTDFIVKEYDKNSKGFC